MLAIDEMCAPSEKETQSPITIRGLNCDRYEATPSSQRLRSALMFSPKEMCRPPDNPAPWSEAQTGSSKREGHDRARQPIPKTTSDEQQCNSSGVPLKPSENTVPNLLHGRVVYDRAFLNGSLPKSGARDRCGR